MPGWLGPRPAVHDTVAGAFDVDFVVETQKKILSRPGRFVAIEAKASPEWRRE